MAETKILVDEDGTILEPPVAELYAMELSDGHEPYSAWKNAGGADSEKQRALREALDAHPSFQARVDILKRERALILGDPIYGQAIWMINQAFREARAKRDRPGMIECTKLRLQAAQGVAKLRERTETPPNAAEIGENSRKNIGKPAEKSPQSSRAFDDMKAALVSKGMKNVPEDVE